MCVCVCVCVHACARARVCAWLRFWRTRGRLGGVTTASLSPYARAGRGDDGEPVALRSFTHSCAPHFIMCMYTRLYM